MLLAVPPPPLRCVFNLYVSAFVQEGKMKDEKRSWHLISADMQLSGQAGKYEVGECEA